jgi:hypothetical protein
MVVNISTDSNRRYWISAMNLFLGVWQGTKAERTGYWLHWLDPEGHLPRWGTERLVQKQQRANRWAEQLKTLGVEPQ